MELFLLISQQRQNLFLVDMMKLFKYLHKGVTLIEIILVVVTIGVLAGGFSWYFARNIDLWNLVTFRSEIVSQARLGVVQMVRNIRQIKTSNPDEETIEEADIQTLQFIILSSDNSNVRMRYRFLGNSIFYDLDSDFDGTFEESNILVRGVDAFRFRYYDIDGEEFVTLPLSSEEREGVALVRIELNLQQGDQRIGFNQEVFLRNRKGG